MKKSIQELEHWVIVTLADNSSNMKGKTMRHSIFKTIFASVVLLACLAGEVRSYDSANPGAGPTHL